MKRGDVWWANLDRPAGRRPVLLLSRDPVYGVRTRVTVAPITTRIRGIRTEVRLGLEDGLPRACAVNLDDIDTIPKAQVREFVVTLDVHKIQAVDAAIHFALGLRT
ncbi:MAG: type II toxin-antitoxin system PemK/MazF family toxin [Dehalococcoidia bacterium]